MTDTPFVEPDPDFTPIWEWKRKNNACGTFFNLIDAEDMYEMYLEDNPDLPPWVEMRESVMDSWEWKKGLQDIINERGFEVMATMFDEILAARGSQG